jgi:hypothetical protein
MVLPACEERELGQPCGTEPLPVQDPIEGEVPVVEVVRVERDRKCDSFHCLSHRGLTPYCTRECELEAPTVERKSCSGDDECTGGEFAAGQTGHCVDGGCRCEEDSECKSPLHCGDGRCRDDDCPEGYWCKTVQDIGPLAGQRYCVFNDTCTRNADCEAFGVMECSFLGCFDACLRDYLSCPEQTGACIDNLDCYAPCPLVAPGVRYCPGAYRISEEAAACDEAGCFEGCESLDAECGFHRLICEPLPALGCTCLGADDPSDLQSCPNQNIVCQPDTTAQPWAAGTVDTLNVCQPEGA